MMQAALATVERPVKELSAKRPMPDRTGCPQPKSPWKEARILQNLILDAALKEGTKPADLASLARAWDVLEERKRILRGIPLPGSFQPSIDGIAQSSKWVAKLRAAKAAKQALETSKMIDLPAIEGPPPGEEKGIS